MVSRLLRIAALAAALAAGPALTASAAVVTEADGQFSRDWRAPTAIGLGADTILGTAEMQNGHEYLVLTGLPSGAQSLTFTFNAPAWALGSGSYSAGGQILWSQDAPRWDWYGTGAGSYQLSRWTPQQTLTLNLGAGFAGPLYLGIFFTHGSDVAWSLSAPTNAAPEAPAAQPAAVPLPASALQILAAMMFLGALGAGGRVRSILVR